MINVNDLAHRVLLDRLIGEDKTYPTEECIYIKDTDNILTYIPEVFDIYVDIYNEILLDMKNEDVGTEYNPETQTMDGHV